MIYSNNNVLEENELSSQDISPNKLKVLQVIPSLEMGGISSVVMNWYRNLDHENYQFDFITFNEGLLRAEIEQLGGTIHLIPTLRQKPLAYIHAIRNVFALQRYDAVHVHNSFKNGLLLLLARIAGVKVRVCHSHTSGVENAWLKPVFGLLKWLAKSQSNVHIACGNEAGKFLYGNSNFILLNNAISVEKFTLNKEDDALKVVEKYNLPKEKKLIFHVGRFSIVKNHAFILQLATKKELSADVHFVLVGEGPLKNDIAQQVNELNLADKVTLLPANTDIAHLLKIASTFIMPSLFEGVSVALLEAQASSLPCYIADTIAKETDMELGLMNFLSLQTPDTWLPLLNNSAKKIIDKDTVEHAFSIKGFSTKSVLAQLMAIYTDGKP
jgi:glycosyltransferase EpsF